MSTKAIMENEMQVKDILAKKSNATYTVTPSHTVTALSALLRERRIGAAVVSHDGRSVDGVVTDGRIGGAFTCVGVTYSEAVRR